MFPDALVWYTAPMAMVQNMTKYQNKYRKLIKEINH